MMRHASSNISLLISSDLSAWKTDLGANFGIFGNHIHKTLKWEKGNPYLAIHSEQAEGEASRGLWLSLFGGIHERDIGLPEELSEHVSAIKFRARSLLRPLRFKVEVKGPDHILKTKYFEVGKRWRTFSVSFPAKKSKEVVFVIEGGEQSTLHLDNVSLVWDDNLATMPTTENKLLEWTRKRCLNFFLWNYREPELNRGFVLERNNTYDLISSAGMGFAFPAIILAGEEKLLSRGEAKRRVEAMLRWLTELDCTNGHSGWHGFPYHFLYPEGNRAGESEVSTVDWAICAAGIRVARQYYREDKEISSLTERLLDRPNWKAVVSRSNLIAHGIDSKGGLLKSDWGSSFTEEAHLTALEALATGKVPSLVMNNIRRQEHNGFWPSWFGSGFTYNWLQLWTGPREPLAANSTRAFMQDANFCRKRTNMSLMGYTETETFSGFDNDGFLKWDIYGENGSDAYHAPPADISHMSVSPYCAALALPFVRGAAVEALFEYIRIGAAHPLIGFAESVRIEGRPEIIKDIVSNWTQFAIHVGPMWMAIESCVSGGGRIAERYLADPAIRSALEHLDASFH